jgi:sugar phosphate isomerase/epimerase
MSTPFIPSLLLAETYFPIKEEMGFAADVIERSVAEGFYQSFEIGDIKDREERKRIWNLKENNHVVITEWFTYLIDREQLNVSSLDPKLRKKTVQRLKEETALAAECGASNIAFVTGPDPGAERRQEGMNVLVESLCEICEEAQKYNMTVLVEHLDRIAHKKRILGPIDETVQVLRKVRENYSNIGIAFDTAHAALNGEDIIDAIQLGKDFVQQIHFSNAVLDPASPLYGDHHMAIGEPGFLTKDKIQEILVEVEKMGLCSENGLRVAIEARTQNKKALDESVKHTRYVLEYALQATGTKY